jgi:hypothetical protein
MGQHPHDTAAHKCESVLPEEGPTVEWLRAVARDYIHERIGLDTFWCSVEQAADHFSKSVYPVLEDDGPWVGDLAYQFAHFANLKCSNFRRRGESEDDLKDAVRAWTPYLARGADPWRKAVERGEWPMDPQN